MSIVVFFGAFAFNLYLPAKPDRAALVFAVIAEFVAVAFYPFIFLVMVPLDNIPYPMSWYHYGNEKRIVVLKKNVRFSNYHNNTTNERSDGTILIVPKGSKLEVAIVDMIDYPDKPAEVGTSFYECDSGLYTLWGGMDLDWFEDSSEIVKDLDAQRAKESKLKVENRIKASAGLLITVSISGLIVFLFWKLLRNSKEYHIVLVTLLILVNILLIRYAGVLYYKILD
ncbi:MAG: hypothetical protein J5715_03300 [Clostridiales bacterium]|nr:hypothetical protein [Clostridiales bacterium]